MESTRTLDGALTLYQAEWCPFSSAVREVLTELGLDFVARQVAPWPEQRDALLAATGTREIPDHLRGRDPWRFAAAHRRRFLDHRDARESDPAAQIVDFFGGAGGL